MDSCDNCEIPNVGAAAPPAIAEISEIRVRLADVQGRLAVLGSIGYAYALGPAVAAPAELVEYSEEQVETKDEHA